MAHKIGRIARAAEKHGVPPEMLAAYLEAALWSSNHYAPDGDDDYVEPRGLGDDDPYDKMYDIEDVDDESLDRQAKFIAEFLAKPGVAEAVTTVETEYDGDDGKIGHNLWLSSQGHGTGFWDRDWEDAGDLLDERAKYNEWSVHSYEGKDGESYISIQ